MSTKSVTTAVKAFIEAVKPSPATSARIRGIRHRRLVIDSANAKIPAVSVFKLGGDSSLSFRIEEADSRATLKACPGYAPETVIGEYASVEEAREAQREIHRTLAPSFWSVAWKVALLIIILGWLTSPTQNTRTATGPQPSYIPPQMAGQAPVNPGILPAPVAPQPVPPAPAPKKDAFGLDLPQ